MAQPPADPCAEARSPARGAARRRTTAEAVTGWAGVTTPGAGGCEQRENTMRERVKKSIEQGFEKFLWNSRFVVLLAVVSSMLSSMILFVIATFDVFELINKVFKYVT